MVRCNAQKTTTPTTSQALRPGRSNRSLFGRGWPRPPFSGTRLTKICPPCVSPIIFLSLFVASVRARYRLIEFQPSATFCRRFHQPYRTHAPPKRPAYPICFTLIVCACTVKGQTYLDRSVSCSAFKRFYVEKYFSD